MAEKQPGEIRLTYNETRLAYNALANSKDMPPPVVDLLGKLYRAILVRAPKEEREELGRRLRDGINCAGRLCPECGIGLNRVDDYYQCHRCKGEWWPDDRNAKATALDCWRDEQRLKKQRVIKKGSGNRSGRNRHKPLLRKGFKGTTTEE